MFWKARTSTVHPDAAWKLQNQGPKDNPVYRFVNFQKKGRLIEVYESQGAAAAESVIRDEMQCYLYDHGKGKLVTKIEYIRWKYSKVTEPIYVYHSLCCSTN